jgi:hypothetical protein
MGHGQRNHPDEDPVKSARAETAAFTKRKLKRYGLLTLGNIAAMGLISEGMPGHALASVLGVPLAISFACFFAPTLYFGAMLVGEWLDKTQ